VLDALVYFFALPLIVGIVLTDVVAGQPRRGLCTNESGVVRNCMVPNETRSVLVFTLQLIATVVGFLAYAWMVGRRGQSVAGRALGVAVVDVDTGVPIGFVRALGRLTLRTFVSIPLLGIGCAVALFDPLRQTLHDRAANSLVVDAVIKQFDELT
jgi:uncharacterized RDD family membrane protein YckC